MYARAPVLPLRPYVARLWASIPSAMPQCGARRERVLPTGAMHIVFRLGRSGLTVYGDDAARTAQRFAPAVVGGPRASAYCKLVEADDASVGAMLHPGVVEPLTGTPMRDLAGAHLNLDELWPAGVVASLVARLAETPNAEMRVALLERALLDCIALRAPRDPLVTYALRELGAGASVAAIVEASGFSHRHFGRRFTAAVGMTPKTWSRLQRFDAVLASIDTRDEDRWVEIAATAGYADQAHLVREFREFAGVTPGEYRRRRPTSRRHVPEP